PQPNALARPVRPKCGTAAASFGFPPMVEAATIFGLHPSLEFSSRMRTDELDYDLPADRIAAAPLAQRDQAKLMVIDRAADAVSHRRVCDLPGLLRPGDLLVVNDSRVLPAYLEGVRAGTGGRVTGLYLHTDEAGRWTVLLESRGSLTPGERITLDDAAALELLERREGGAWLAHLNADADTPTVLSRVGR